MSTAAVTTQPTQAPPQGLTLVTATPAAKAKSAVLMEVVVNRDVLLARSPPPKASLHREQRFRFFPIS